MLAALVAGSLLSIGQPLPVQGGDKLQHLLAYGLTMYWWGMLAPPRRFHWALGLILLGGALEILQAFTPERTMEWQDAVANLTGVLAGLAALTTRASGLVALLDSKIGDRLYPGSP